VTLRADPRAPGLHVGEGVSIADDAVIGAHVTIHAGTVVGAGCVIEDGAVLGKRPRRLGVTVGELPALVIGPGVTVCTGAVVLAGARIDAGALLGDQSFVREHAHIGPGTVIGRGSAVDPDVRVGARVRVQTNVYITGASVVEDDVFIGPGVCMTNDDTMARHPPAQPLRGAILRRACRIGGGVVLVPGVEIGEEAFVGAGAVVTRDVPPRTVVIGSPAREWRRVTDDELLERWR